VSAPSTWRRTPSDAGDWFSAEELARSHAYQRPLTRLRLIRIAFGLAVVVAFVFGHLARRLIDAFGLTGWVVPLAAVLVTLQLVALVYDVPLDVWVDLKHDRRWDISTQTGKGLAADEVKSFLLGVVTSLLVVVPLYAIVRTTEWWWLWGWLLVVGFSTVFGFVFPVVIAPIFNRFTRLTDGEIATRVDDVARRAGVTISGTYVADESRRSRRDNAYVAGLGATRRVVLYDTLLEHPPEIVEQVVAHEIGHWRLHHLRRQLPLAAAMAFIVFALLGALGQWGWLADRAGLDPDQRFGDPASLPLVLLLVQGGFAVLNGAGAFVSRAFERQADAQALELLGRPDRLIDMHRRLHVKNLADLEPGRLKRLQATHPPAAERMAFATAWAGAHNVRPSFTPRSPTTS
jgi:STE24 endopeptidase